MNADAGTAASTRPLTTLRARGGCDGAVSIAVLFVVLVGVVSCIAVTISFVSIFFQMQSEAAVFIRRFADGAVESTHFLVDRHFLTVRRMSLLAQRVMNEQAAPYPSLMLQHMLLWFARDAIAQNVQYIVVNGLDNGFRIGQTILLPEAGPVSKLGYCSVSNISAGRNVTAGFYSLDNFELEASVEMIDVPVKFNFTAVSWSKGFRSEHIWSEFYLGVLSKTSAIAIGGPFQPPGGSDTANFPMPGAYSLHDFTQAIVDYFSTLKISKTGAAILIDTKTRAFVGGNIIDRSVIGTSPGPLRLALLEDLTDGRIAPVVAAAATLGGNILLTCQAPCMLAFLPESGRLLPEAAHRFSLFSPYCVVRVVALADAYGLSMRLIFVLPSDDFAGPLRRGATVALIVPACLIVGIMVVVFFSVRRILRPLRDVERLLLSLTKSRHGGSSAAIGLGGDRNELDLITSGSETTTAVLPSSLDWDERILQRLTATHRRSSFSEIDVIQSACAKLNHEMSVFRSFLGHAATHAAFSSSADSSFGAPSVVDEFPGGVGPSRSSVQSEHRDVPGGGPTAASYVPGTLWNVPVTTVVANLADFEATRHALLPSRLVAMHAKYLSVLQAVVRRHSGVVDELYGDRLWIHFNAAHRVVQHAAAAARMVLAADAALRAADLPSYNGVCFGVATANALCGVMGSSRLKAFTVVGESTAHAFQLMWQAKVDGFVALMSWRTAKLLTSTTTSKAAAVVAAQNVRFAMMPHDDRVRTVARPIPLDELRSVCFPTATSEDEARGLLQLCNDASELGAEGNVEGAMELYQTVDERHLAGDWIATVVCREALNRKAHTLALSK